jgi:hypothetical protein
MNLVIAPKYSGTELLFGPIKDCIPLFTSMLNVSNEAINVTPLSIKHGITFCSQQIGLVDHIQNSQIQIWTCIFGLD